MGTGAFPDRSLELVKSVVGDLPGDLAEVGVFRGGLFKRLCGWARASGRCAHAFDSFVGMAAPGQKDSNHYPAGKFNVGGSQGFERILKAAGCSNYRLWPGFVPAGFRDFEAGAGDVQFAFGYVDLDHHDPTVVALEWIWPRIAVGGVLGMDDYFRQPWGGASDAVDAWLPKVAGQFVEIDFSNNQLLIRKVG